SLWRKSRATPTGSARSSSSVSSLESSVIGCDVSLGTLSREMLGAWAKCHPPAQSLPRDVLTLTPPQPPPRRQQSPLVLGHGDKQTTLTTQGSKSLNAPLCLSVEAVHSTLQRSPLRDAPRANGLQQLRRPP